MKPAEQTAQLLLDELNETHRRLHKNYEDLFWISYMGDHSVDKKKDTALAARDAFRGSQSYATTINEMLPSVTVATRKRLQIWLDFFKANQVPAEAVAIKQKIDKLESKILRTRSKQKQGYVDPYTKKFVPASELQMQGITLNSPDEKIRKACFKAIEALPLEYVDDYVKLVGLRNTYAQKLGYADFYDYKLQAEDKTTKKELFSIFDNIYEQTKYALDDLRAMQKDMPGLLKPWNFGHMMSGDFTKEEDQYFNFEEAIPRWGQSFAALGVDFHGSKLQLDLCDRKGKWNNGFCHWPDIVTYRNGKRIAGSSNFTCNVVMGQPGSGYRGYHTLFHEGGHAAHLLNVEQQENCLNTEYPPATASWDETQSMFMDSILNSIEWKQRYARNADGEAYPLDLFKRKAKKFHALSPLGLSGVLFVTNFERAIYEERTLTVQKVLTTAKKMYRKYYGRSEDSTYALNVPHIYNWESSAAYHGYGLAELAVSQWRHYFYKKYGYIVDNKHVGKEMVKVWKLGSSKNFHDCVKIATGKKLSPDACLKSMTAPLKFIFVRAEKRIARLNRVKRHVGPVRLNAVIKMVDGKKTIADSGKSFEDMAAKYGAWLRNKIKK
jgi:oligoendopeptidase F